MNEHKKAAIRAANKLAKGGMDRKAKARTVSKWAAAMKAIIQGGK